MESNYIAGHLPSARRSEEICGRRPAFAGRVLIPVAEQREVCETYILLIGIRHIINEKSLHNGWPLLNQGGPATVWPSDR